MKTPIKQLLVRLNQVVRPNMGNALFALFLALICETVLGMIFAAPAMMMLTRNPSLNQTIFAAMLVFCSLIIWLLFQYGFHVLILRMVRHEYVTLGYVFFGFKEIKRVLPLLLTIGLIVSLLTIALVAGGRIVTAQTGLADAVAKQIESVQAQVESTQAKALQAPAESIKEAESGQSLPQASDQSDDTPLSDNQDAVLNQAVKQLGILLAIYALLIVLVFIRFVFVFYLHFDSPDDGVLTLFKKSARLMKNNCFRLIRLMLGAGGKNLVTAIFIFTVTYVISSGSKGGQKGGFSILMMLLNFMYFINIYTALLKMYFALPVLYTDALLPQVEVTITDDENSQVLADTAALLTEDAEDSNNHDSLKDAPQGNDAPVDGE